ncbi:MAG: CYTH domain-containing protein [Bacteroidales bacterium]|nr:CYTH domain-containing protein [Bacteroidales bacterium]
MHIETERKFLVKDLSFKDLAIRSYEIRQGYVAHDGGNTVRVRIRDKQGFLTIKGPSLNGISRYEWEREIPLEDARELFLLCRGGSIEKTRYIVPDGEKFFEVDVFYGENEGLVMAEIELERPDEPFERPDWLGREVTGDRRFYNSHLLRNPFKLWRETLDNLV